MVVLEYYYFLYGLRLNLHLRLHLQIVFLVGKAYYGSQLVMVLPFQPLTHCLNSFLVVHHGHAHCLHLAHTFVRILHIHIGRNYDHIHWGSYIVPADATVAVAFGDGGVAATVVDAVGGDEPFDVDGNYYTLHQLDVLVVVLLKLS